MWFRLSCDVQEALTLKVIPRSMQMYNLYPKYSYF